MVKKMTTDADILGTFRVMKQLRTHLDEAQFLDQVKRQQASQAYNIAAAHDSSGTVRCVAGYRFSETLAWGKFLYVDDLVTDQEARCSQFGKQMMEWLLEEARVNSCRQLHLDSGVQRHGAHRFYLRERMDITCFHFKVTV